MPVNRWLMCWIWSFADGSLSECGLNWTTIWGFGILA